MPKLLVSGLHSGRLIERNSFEFISHAYFTIFATLANPSPGF